MSFHSDGPTTPPAGCARSFSAAAIALGRRWLADRPVPLTAAGAVLFGAGSAWCGGASSLPSLLAGRVAQGVGAAALLSGALAILCAYAGRERGRRLWSGAATAGLAVGPALGGALTEAFSWRMIFLGQVPVAVLVLAALIRAPRRAPAPSTEVGVRRPAIWANFGYVTLFAGLVGALFLGVLLLVEVWGFAPLLAAGVMTALPAGTLLAGAAREPSLRFGAAGLAAGLVALALLPAADVAWAAAALFVCGAGAGMVMKALGAAAVPAGARPVRAGAAVVAAKHAGLVLGLVVIAPLLSASLQDGGERAVVAGTGVVLDARMPVQDKLRLAMSVRDALADTPRGAVPDVRKAFGDNATAEQVDEHLRAVLTRAFRPAFGAAAVLALLTVAAGFGLRTRNSAARSRVVLRRAVAVPAALALLAVGIIGAEVRAGARHFGQYAESQPCSAPADPYPGTDLDALVQRVAYGALNGAACELGLSRERFVLAAAGQPGFATVQWNTPTVQRAVRAGMERAIDDADHRDDLPGWAASIVRATVSRLPISRILEILGFTGD
jgi:predicted MFS family arabinose efflux permease